MQSTTDSVFSILVLSRAFSCFLADHIQLLSCRKAPLCSYAKSLCSGTLYSTLPRIGRDHFRIGRYRREAPKQFFEYREHDIMQEFTLPSEICLGCKSYRREISASVLSPRAVSSAARALNRLPCIRRFIAAKWPPATACFPASIHLGNCPVLGWALRSETRPVDDKCRFLADSAGGAFLVMVQLSGLRGILGSWWSYREAFQEMFQETFRAKLC